MTDLKSFHHTQLHVKTSEGAT